MTDKKICTLAHINKSTLWRIRNQSTENPHPLTREKLLKVLIDG